MTKALRKAIMPTSTLEIVKTGKTTRHKEMFAQTYSKKTKKWILSWSKYKGTKRHQKVLEKN